MALSSQKMNRAQKKYAILFDKLAYNSLYWYCQLGTEH